MTSRNVLRLLLSLALLLGAGCSTLRVYSSHDPAADFGAYRTYGFVPELGTDGPQYGSLMSRHLKAVAARELEARGYVPGEEPDLLVNFYIRTEDRLYSVRQPSSFYGFRQLGFWNYGVWGGYVGFETSVRQYTEGALHVDVVDRLRRQVVWEAVVVDTLREGDLQDPRGFAERRVHEAFAEYPFRAGGDGAPGLPGR